MQPPEPSIPRRRRGEQDAAPQVADSKAKPRLVSLNTAKSAADIAPVVRGQIADYIMIQPNHERVTKKFGSNLLQVIFSALHEILWRQRRLEQRMNERDGFGRINVVQMPNRRAAMRDYLGGAA
jgi:adenylate kinase